MDTVAILVVCLRGAHLLTLVSLFGALLCATWVTPMLRLVRLERWSFALTILFGVGWFAAQAALIAQPDTVAEYARDLGAVAEGTRFGHVVLLRLAVLLLVWAVPRRPAALSLCVAGLALASQGLVGHAGAAGGSAGATLVIVEALHLVAAAAWLGSLLPLWLAVRWLPREHAVQALLRFSPIGMAAAMLVAGSALFQAASLVGSVPALIGTRYGLIALLKLALFGGMLALAARNRFSLTDRLAAGGGRAALQRSVAIECILGGAVIVVGALLASTTPGAHEQHNGPLAWRADACVTASTDAGSAGVILARLDVREFAGTALLIDPHGILRAVRWPGEAPAPADTAAVQEICETRLPPRIGVAHEHHH